MKNLGTIIIGFLVLSFLNACSDDNNCISGSGDYVSRTYTVSNFDALSVGGDAEIYITKDSINTLRIDGQENILNTLNVNVNNNTLSIGDDNCFNDMKTLKIYASSPNLIGINCSGTCNVYSYDLFTASVFTADISGTGSMDLNLNVQELNTNISGDASMTIKGLATEQNYNISGDGEYNCFELLGEQANIDISGIGDLEVNVNQELDITISGVGTIHYKGSPSITQKISGAGTITQVD